MISTKYIGMDVHKESISIAVLSVAGKVVIMCCIPRSGDERTVLSALDPNDTLCRSLRVALAKGYFQKNFHCGRSA